MPISPCPGGGAEGHHVQESEPTLEPVTRSMVTIPPEGEWALPSKAQPCRQQPGVTAFAEEGMRGQAAGLQRPAEPHGPSLAVWLLQASGDFL